MTATAATCASCHHRPQNERCESGHRLALVRRARPVHNPLAADVLLRAARDKAAAALAR